MKRALGQIRRILTKKQRRGILLLMAGGLFLALLDTITVALMAAANGGQPYGGAPQYGPNAYGAAQQPYNPYGAPQQTYDPQQPSQQ